MATKKEVIKKEDKIEDTIKETRRRKRIKIDKDIEIRFINFTSGNFVYRNGDTYFDLSEYGDFDYMTFEELNKMNSAHKAILQNFWILLVDVEDDEITLEDVLERLGLSTLYSNKLNENTLDEMLLEYDTDDFINLFNKIDRNLKERIIERAVVLFKAKQLNNYSKMNEITKYLNNDNFFSDIENTEKFLEERKGI